MGAVRAMAAFAAVIAAAMAMAASAQTTGTSAGPVASQHHASVAEPTQTAAFAGRGQVTNLPLPRFVSLKTDKGNARRGPGLTHRIDWVFVRPGMPLLVTAEHEHWRRVEDAEGAGGWVHYSLLSGSRSVLVAEDLTDLRTKPDPDSQVVARAELGVIARVLACRDGWCRITRDGLRGWVPESALWGVAKGETFD